MLRQAIAAALIHIRQQQQVLLTDSEEGATSAHLIRVEHNEHGVTV
ncbi:hypothetical protein I8746_06135 [Pseudomonas sp. USTB-Z]|jgi:hypothetical protein|nr:MULTISPECIES: hypothetical protein [Pseudomonas]MBF8789670.1 hypothetical protein [Pseudomonas asiatica]MBX6689172.1 hypothetical protein [Pseudomonas sp. USTB-Z]